MQNVHITREDDSVFLKFLPFIVCFSASLFFFYEFIQGNMFASIADNLMHDFQIDVQSMAYLSSIYYLSNVIFLFVAGYILDHFSPKKTLLWAMLLCVLSTFVFSQTHSYGVALLCRFITGIGSAFCFLGPIRIATHWFPINRMATVTGCVVTFAMLGGILSQYPLTQMVELWGWRFSVLLIACLGLILLGLMYFGIREVETSYVKRATYTQSMMQIFRSIYLNTKILRAAMYTSLMNMSVAVFGAMMGTLYLVQRLGVHKSEAAMINSMLFLGAIVGGPLMGWISDRMEQRVLPMKISALLAFVLILGIMFLPLSMTGMMIAFFLLGVITAAQVISYALVAELSSPQITAMAVSAISVLTQGGYVVYQNVFSFLLTHLGTVQMVHGVASYSLVNYQRAATIFPLGLLGAYFLMLWLREHSRIEV